MSNAQEAGQAPVGARVSHEETRRLLALARAGDVGARNALVEANLRLVASITRRFAHRADPDDLFQVGCIGLMHAIDKFNLDYDVKFSTYAVPLILGEIHRFLREDRAVKVTRHGLDLARRASEARDALELELGRSPTPQEIGERIGVAKEEVVSALDAVTTPASLDEPVPTEHGEPGRSRMDQISSQSGMPEIELVDGLALQAALLALNDLERQVLVWRFVQERRQVEVAARLGVSQAHVSRLERRILRRVREYLSR